MTDSRELQKRILLIACTLGVLAGVIAYLAYKSVVTDNFALLAVVPAVLLISIPMVNALRRLQALRRGE